MNSNLRPRTIKGNFTIQVVGTETLVYDERRHLAFCLNRVSAAIWRMCDGEHTVATIAQAVTLELASPVTEEIVLFALAELRRGNLLEAETVATIVPAVSRRALMGKMGLTAAMLVPAVAMIVAPKAAQAYAGNVSGVNQTPVNNDPGNPSPSDPNKQAPSSPSSGWTWKP